MTRHTVTHMKGDTADFADAHGRIPIRMTNDYLFRALMQRNENVLKALIRALLHLKPEELRSVTILNPIELGEWIDDKNFILDIKVELNHHSVLNLEMQMLNEKNWPERSLCYLCRAFDNLNRGEEYENVRPAIQIGLLDFTLFESHPEFYANYYLMNEKSHQIYSSKFRLSVLCLNQIKMATKEDRLYEIDKWAALFKATTWEELKMLTKSNPYIEEAATAVYHLTQEEKIRQQCEAREDYYRRTAGRERLVKKQAELLEKAQAEKAQLISEKEQAIANAERLNSEKEQAIANAERLNSEKEQAIANAERLARLLKEHGIPFDEDNK